MIQTLDGKLIESIVKNVLVSYEDFFLDNDNMFVTMRPLNTLLQPIDVSHLLSDIEDIFALEPINQRAQASKVSIQTIIHIIQNNTFRERTLNHNILEDNLDYISVTFKYDLFNKTSPASILYHKYQSLILQMNLK